MTMIRIATCAAAVVLGIALVSPHEASARLAANSRHLNGHNLNAFHLNGSSLNSRKLNAMRFNGSALHGRELSDAEREATGFNVNAVTVREVILDVAPQRPEGK